MKKQILSLLFIAGISCNISCMEIAPTDQTNETKTMLQNIEKIEQNINILNNNMLEYKALYESEKNEKLQLKALCESERNKRLQLETLYKSERSNNANKPNNQTISTSINNVPNGKTVSIPTGNTKTRSFFQRPLFATFGLGCLGIFGTLYYNGSLGNYLHGFNFSPCGTFSTLNALPYLSMHNLTKLFNK